MEQTKKLTESIEKMVVLSTAHLPHDEYEMARAGLPIEMPRTIPHEYGTLMRIAFDPADLSEQVQALNDGGLPVLASLVTWARNLGLLWLNFDQDGDIFDEVAHFEW